MLEKTTEAAFKNSSEQSLLRIHKLIDGGVRSTEVERLSKLYPLPVVSLSVIFNDIDLGPKMCKNQLSIDSIKVLRFMQHFQQFLTFMLSVYSFNLESKLSMSDIMVVK